MIKINFHEIPWEERRSPGGKYNLFRKELSIALGSPRHTGTWGGGHPFDVELTRVPAGALNWPLHSHDTQWEFFVVLEGSAELRAGEETVEIVSGDCFMIPPGTARHIHNSGEADLVYFVIADNPVSDVVYYPDSDKWQVKPRNVYFRMDPVGNCYEGEE